MGWIWRGGTPAFLDLAVLQGTSTPPGPKDGECPLNMELSYFNRHHYRCYQVVLRTEAFNDSCSIYKSSSEYATKRSFYTVLRKGNVYRLR